MRRRLLALGIACTLVGLAAPAAGASPLFGFNDVNWGAGSSVPPATLAELQANAGANTTRLSVDWRWFEPSPGAYNFYSLDRAYAADLQNGVRPLITLTGAPRWTHPPSALCLNKSNPCAYPPAPRHYDAYGAALKQIIRRYPAIVGVEIWNEPTLRWTWSPRPDPEAYTELLKTAYRAVKAVDPEMPVITGGLPPVLTESTSDHSWGVRPFLQAMYDAGARGYFDAIGVHPYPYDVDWGISLRQISIVKETMLANGDYKPLWATEFGMTTTGQFGTAPSSTIRFNDYQQAITLRGLSDALKTDPAIEALYVHSLIDDSDHPNVADRGYGVMRSAQLPKPAYCTLATANQAPAACPMTQALPTAAQSARWAAQTTLQLAVDSARTVHLERGTYAGLTAADLNAVDPRISAVAADSATVPGLEADPSSIAIWPPLPGQPDRVLLCNASQTDRSYCAYVQWRGVHMYGSAAGSIQTAATDTKNSRSWSW